jgi:hypothetical protein
VEVRRRRGSIISSPLATLQIWIGDAIPAQDRHKLLRIKELAATANDVVSARIAEAASDDNSHIAQCVRCGKEAMLRPHPKSGASCLYCGYVPVADWSEE